MARVSPESIARNLANVNARISEHRARVSAYKIRMQCHDCPVGVFWPACALQLDHRPGETKTGDVSKMMARSWDAIAAEIAKTDVVCGGHHAMRTQARLRA